MKKIFIALSLMLISLSIGGKTTYIPTYYSYIHLQQGNDSASISDNKTELEMQSFDKSFTISIHHEDITREKVKAIKRAKAVAGWSVFNGVMSIISPGIRGSIFSSIQDGRNTRQLMKMDAENAKAEQILQVEIWIDNNSNEELMVHDMVRGLVWYVQPKESLQLEISNPEVAKLRISDIKSQSISYATIGAGSTVKKETIGWEDDNCWVVIREIENSYRDDYIYISKKDFSERKLTPEEKKRVEKYMIEQK